MKRNIFAVLLILSLSFFAIKPFFVNGFFPMHDNTQVQRVFEMGKSLSDGMVPVRWVSDLGYGYGYPLFTFYAPLAYYIGGFLTAVPVSALVATKMMMVLGILLSGVFMYLLAQSIWGKAGGIIAALFYMYAPYHAVDVYVRGDVAEFWAYAFIPLVFYGVWRLYKTPNWVSVAIGASGFAGVILSHNLTALMLSPFLILSLCAISLMSFKKNKKVVFYSLLLFLFGFGLSAFYFLPVFAEMQYTNVLSQVGGGADFHDHFVCLSQLWQSPWGYGGSVKGCVDGLSFMVGKLHLLIALFSLGVLPLLFRKDREKAYGVIFGLIGLTVALFLLLEASLFVWNSIHVMAFLQYPWRFLLFASFFSSFLAGSFFFLLPQKWMNVAAVGFLGAVCIFVNAKYFVPQMILPLTSEYYTNTNMLTWTASQISDEYLPKHFIKPTAQLFVPQGLLTLQKGTYHVSVNKTQKKTLKVMLPLPEQVTVRLAYFPAWKGYIDGKKTTLTPTDSGMQIKLPAGTHTLTLIYEETFVELLGDIVSLASGGILVLAIIIHRKRSYGAQS